MPMQMVATCAATLGACESSARKSLKSNRTIAWRAALGLFMGPLLAGCVTTVPLVGADPGDPGVKVAGVGYRSTIAPYVPLRPASAAGWKDQNQRLVPTPKNEQ
jgi:hypothetical protein